MEEVAIELPALPPLSVLIDSAFQKSPQRAILEKQKQVSEINLGMTKRELLQGVSLGSTYSYGKGGIIGVSQSTNNASTAIYNNQTTSQYGVGLSVSVSIGAILDRKSKIRLGKLQTSQITDQIQQLEDEIAIRIYEEYTRLQLNLESLKSAAMIQNSYQAQLILAEKEYLNNRIELQQVTTAREAYSKSILELDKLRRDCRISVFYLERMTGVGFMKNFNGKLQL